VVIILCKCFRFRPYHSGAYYASIIVGVGVGGDGVWCGDGAPRIRWHFGTVRRSAFLPMRGPARSPATI